MHCTFADLGSNKVSSSCKWIFPHSRTASNGAFDENQMYFYGLKICGILVANATMFFHLLPGFSCGSKHLLLP